MLASEFAQELEEYGHIYMYRFRPTLAMRAYPCNEYPARCRAAAAIMHMVMNNLDPKVAQVRGRGDRGQGGGAKERGWCKGEGVVQVRGDGASESVGS